MRQLKIPFDALLFYDAGRAAPEFASNYREFAGTAATRLLYHFNLHKLDKNPSEQRRWNRKRKIMFH